MPGPPIAVCKGDMVSVEVRNKLHTETTTLHFHGDNYFLSFCIFLMHYVTFEILGEHFKGSQFMDGSPYVTQCPILPDTT